MQARPGRVRNSTGGNRPRFLRALGRSLLVAIALAAIVANTSPTMAEESGDTVEMTTLVKYPDGSLVSETIEVSRTQAKELQAAAVAGSVSALAMVPSADGRGQAKLIAAEPVVTFEAFADPYRSNQWPLDATSFEAASAMVDPSSVVVAVLDTGIRGTHEDLVGVLVDGADFVSGSGSGLIPDHFHGSHVAGVVGAATGNAKGIEAAAVGVGVMPVRVLDSSGSGSSTNVANGIIWAVDNGADVINLSLGSTSNSTTVESAIDYATANNVVVVAASGNSGNLGNPTMYPAALDSVLSVGAIDESKARADFSGYGNWLDVVAPGVSVLSLHNGGDSDYAYANGTSMASPHVSAAAALVLAANPSLDPSEVRATLMATAEDLGAAGDDDDFGAGLIDPEAAVTAALGGTGSGGSTAPDTGEGPGYAFVTSAGRVITVGTADSQGSMEGQSLAQPVVTAASSDSGNGYWMAAGDGGIFSFGDAGYHGSTGDLTLQQPIVGMSPTPTGNGYWLVAGDGGIFSFGDALFHGSTGGMSLRAPIVGMAPTVSGNGYWLVASDGGIFAFGDAGFHGSTGAMTLKEPIVGMSPTVSGNGYWLVASDGGIFAFGDAGFHGSTGAMALDQPIVGMAPTPTGTGYWMFAQDGGVFSFNAPYAGSAAGQLQPGETAVALIDIAV
ncbi:MAG: S8 family serine peptidase [Actinomycetia bacterium]|nr:S8 family serine peptidase [Actinomycetes bacterium]